MSKSTAGPSYIYCFNDYKNSWYLAYVGPSRSEAIISPGLIQCGVSCKKIQININMPCRDDTMKKNITINRSVVKYFTILSLFTMAILAWQHMINRIIYMLKCISHSISAIRSHYGWHAMPYRFKHVLLSMYIIWFRNCIWHIVADKNL
jgi:hypothetical protein